MSYRDDDSEPLIVAGSQGIQALDPHTGVLLWKHEWPPSDGFNRVASQGGIVLLANGHKVQFYERKTGRKLAEHTVPFVIQAAFARDLAWFVAGTGGIACFQGMSPTWRIERRDVSSWLNNETSWVHVAGGIERKLEGFGGTGHHSDLTLVLGDDVVQPDRDT